MVIRNSTNGTGENTAQGKATDDNGRVYEA